MRIKSENWSAALAGSQVCGRFLVSAAGELLACNKSALVHSIAYLSGATTPMTRLFQARDDDNADMTMKRP